MKKIKNAVYVIICILLLIFIIFGLHLQFELENTKMYYSIDEALSSYSVEDCSVLQEVKTGEDVIVLLYDQFSHGVFLTTVKKNKHGYVLENQSPQCFVGINDGVEMDYTNGQQHLVLKISRQNGESGTEIPRFEISYEFL